MSVKIGRRASDIDMEKWMDVLRQARVKILRAITDGSLPEDAPVELRFSKEFEKQLQESLGKVLLRNQNLTEVLDQLGEAGLVELKHLPASNREVYLLKK